LHDLLAGDVYRPSRSIFCWSFAAFALLVALLVPFFIIFIVLVLVVIIGVLEGDLNPTEVAKSFGSI
jgi:hypothetical protein